MTHPDSPQATDRGNQGDALSRATPSGRATHEPSPDGLGHSVSVPVAEYPPDCPSYYSVSLCGKCRKCERKLAAMAAQAAPHADLIAEQSVRRCRLCTRIERYCQTDGQGRGRHTFTPVMTCESCAHMGERYWGSDDRPFHLCRKSGERRAAKFRSSGDLSQDFMDEFRKSYDASPHQSAETCSFFEPRKGAQAIDARRAETGTGSVHESAVGSADAPGADQ